MPESKNVRGMNEAPDHPDANATIFGVTEMPARGPEPTIVGFAPEYKVKPTAAAEGLAALWRTEENTGVRWFKLYSPDALRMPHPLASSEPLPEKQE